MDQQRLEDIEIVLAQVYTALDPAALVDAPLSVGKAARRVLARGLRSAAQREEYPLTDSAKMEVAKALED